MQRRMLAFAAVVAAACLGTGTAQAAEPLNYVALGDSYSAASGVLPPDPAACPGDDGDLTVEVELFQSHSRPSNEVARRTTSTQVLVHMEDFCQ